MHIERVPNRNSPPAVLLRQSYREGDKVRKRTLANLSKLPDEAVEGLKILLKGGTGDSTTLASQIEKVRHRFGLKRVVFVGDRGLITSSRINEELKNIEGLDWITALRAPQIRQLVEQEYLQLSNREKRPLKGAANIGLRVGKVLNRFKVAKHFHLEITDNSFRYQRHSENIAAEAALDGLYVIRTSVSEELFDSPETVRAYKSLSTVERAFRSYKTVDLKVRPICHRLEGRVRAHIFLCMLAYYVEWHMRLSLAPMLFDDEDKALAEALRDSVVAPAKRSQKAQSKAQKKRTADDLPVHSFQTLLKDLATIVKNRVQPNLPGAKVTFDKITCPTPLQQKAFDLLEVNYLM